MAQAQAAAAVALTEAKRAMAHVFSGTASAAAAAPHHSAFIGVALIAAKLVCCWCCWCRRAARLSPSPSLAATGKSRGIALRGDAGPSIEF
mmetsp:Transcript_29109/g.93270  ORF Transcript_29109/g.93270 Transcript_29109/m.93270 type:complete len:91 (-) Transcript_29109:96-368(-)